MNASKHDSKTEKIITSLITFDELSSIGKIIRLEDGETVLEMDSKFFEIYACDKLGNISTTKPTHSLLLHRAE